ncbi:hypothetical protein Clacol_008447 [Clathrus columnatus]|uniref:Chromatin accessibility complex protein 1 n=1 Tax=Clathrus columnatus TaxID=1419009 RepID=A0AAV5AQM2_9AGAM|nr:hypothetical protein Clacol_008447 [Clathrus columnatus]
MPPRKDTSIPALSLSQSQQDAGSEGIEDVELPKLLVTQLAQKAIQLQRMVRFIIRFQLHLNLILQSAHEVATSRAHKTISGADVSKALETIDFPDLRGYAEQFQSELEIFRQGMKHEKHEKGKNKPPESKGKNKEKESSSKVPNPSSQQPQTTLGTNIDHSAVSEANRGSSVDVDMHDPEE